MGNDLDRNGNERSRLCGVVCQRPNFVEELEAKKKEEGSRGSAGTGGSRRWESWK